MKTLDQLVAEFRNKVEPVIGITGLSNPAENISDPLVQIIINALAGHERLEMELSNILNDLDIRTVSCDRLETLASLIGATKRSNLASTVMIAASGSNGTTIPINTVLRDSLLQKWLITESFTIIDGLGFGMARCEKAGVFTVNPHELLLLNPIAGISSLTNGAMIKTGFILESCEQFRVRILSGDF